MASAKTSVKYAPREATGDRNYRPSHDATMKIASSRKDSISVDRTQLLPRNNLPGEQVHKLHTPTSGFLPLKRDLGPKHPPGSSDVIPATASDDVNPKNHVPRKNIPMHSRQAQTYWTRLAPQRKLDSIDGETLTSRSFGRKIGWSPKGDILQRWNDELFAHIQGIVGAERSTEFIYKRSKKKSPCVCDLWMLSDGNRWEDARPTIVAMCNDGKVARRAIVVLQKNPKLKDLNLGFHFLAWEESIELIAGSVAGNPLVPASDDDLLSLGGLRVLITSTPISSKSKWRDATIGGVLLLGGVYYGLSVAHAFFLNETENDINDSDDESTIRAESATSEDESDLEDFEELEALESELRKNLRNLMSEVESPSAETPASVVYLSQGNSGLESDSSGGSNTGISIQSLSLVGFLPRPTAAQTHSIDGPDYSVVSPWISRDLDWALVRIHDPRFWSPNKFTTTSGATLSTSLVSFAPPNGQVLVTTRFSGPRLSHCWGRKSGLLLPGSRKLQEVWTLGSSSCEYAQLTTRRML